jgi:hypothetical protein
LESSCGGDEGGGAEGGRDEGGRDEDGRDGITRRYVATFVRLAAAICE